MALGKNIKSCREQLGLTLEQLEERSGVAVGTISALENRNSVRSQYAPALAAALGVPLEDLLDQSEDYWCNPRVFLGKSLPDDNKSPEASLLDTAYEAADEPTKVMINYLLGINGERPKWMSPALTSMIESTRAMVAEHFPQARSRSADYPTGTDPKVGSW